MRRLERKIFKEAAKKKLIRSSNSESEEGGNKLNLVCLRKGYPGDAIKKSIPKSSEKAQKQQKRLKGKKQEVAITRRDEEPLDERDEEYQLNFAIQISNDNAKKKGIHRVEIKQWERKEETFTIHVDKREHELEEEFKRKPPTKQELIKKMKAIASIESEVEEVSKNEEDIHQVANGIADSQNTVEHQRLRMEKEFQEYNKREVLQPRRVAQNLEIGDYSYSKPATQCLHMP